VRRTDATTLAVAGGQAAGGTAIVKHAHAASVYHWDWVVMSVDCATFLLLSLLSSPGGGAIAVVGFLKYSPPRRRVGISLYL